MANDDVAATEKAEAKRTNTHPENAGVSSKAEKATESKSTQAKNDSPSEKDTPHRDTDGVENNPDEVSGQNHPAAVVATERDFREQYAALLREQEAEVLGAEPAGDDYLYPDNPVNAQNPEKRNVIAYKYDPTGEAANS